MEEREIGHKNKMAVIRLKCRKEMGGFFFHVFIYLVLEIKTVMSDCKITRLVINTLHLWVTLNQKLFYYYLFTNPIGISGGQ